MKKLLVASVCVIALTIGAQAKPIRQTLIDRWVIEYDSELFAGACIATMGYDLLKLKISFITAYPKEGTENLWFVGLSSPEWTWIKSSTAYDFAIATQRRSAAVQQSLLRSVVIALLTSVLALVLLVGSYSTDSPRPHEMIQIGGAE